MMIAKKGWLFFLKTYIVLLAPILLMVYCDLIGWAVAYGVLITLLEVLLLLFSGNTEIIENQKMFLDEQLDPQQFLEKSKHLFFRATDPTNPTHQAIRFAKRRALVMLGQREVADRIVEELLETAVAMAPVVRAQLHGAKAIYFAEEGLLEEADRHLHDMDIVLSCCRLSLKDSRLFEEFRLDVAVQKQEYAEAEVYFRSELNQPKLTRLRRVALHADLGDICYYTGRTQEAIAHYQFVYVHGNQLPMFDPAMERLKELTISQPIT